MSRPSPSVCFMVGSTRSGTTVIGDCLGKHPGIGHFYEPYYVWEWDIGVRDDDTRYIRLATPSMVRRIRRDFQRFARCSGARVILEKSPGTFGMDLRHMVFPEARWIHVVRDGRDVTLSIHREWQKRARLVKAWSPTKLLDLVRRVFSLQPYGYFRCKQIAFELKTSSPLQLALYRNKSRWKGQVGWGPRFEGWERVLAEQPLLAFNAHQWVECIRHVEEYRKNIPTERFLEVRYEDFLRKPMEILRNIVEFMGIGMEPGFERNVPPIMERNTRKWGKAFTREELETISPVVTPELIRLGYEDDPAWALREG